MSTLSSNIPKLSITDISNIINQTRQAVHAKLNKKGIHTEKSGRSAYIAYATAKALLGLDFKKQTIALHHIKGGVGKTTSTDNIGDCANAMGARVLKIDADFQKNLTIRHNISKETIDERPVLIDLIHGNGTIEDSIIHIADGLDLIPSRFENANLDSALTANSSDLSTCLKDILAPVQNNYDLILIDCPAMLGKLMTAIALYADMIICPLNPEEFSIEGLETFKEELFNIKRSHQKEINYQTFLNKFEASTILSQMAVNDTISQEIKTGHGFDIVVKKSQEIPNHQREHTTLFTETSKSEVRDDFIALTKKILDFDDLFNTK